MLEESLGGEFKLFVVWIEETVRKNFAKSYAQLTESSTRNTKGMEFLPERGCRRFGGARKAALW